MMEDHSQTISPLEMKRIQEAVERSDTEKFLLFTRMMRIHFMLRNAVIIKTAKAINRPKDIIDVMELEKIIQLRGPK